MNESCRPGVDVASRLDSRTGTLTIEETVDGIVWAEGFAVTIAATATIIGDIHARQITVFGTVSGTLAASVRVDLRGGCRVTGRVLTATLTVADGASFTGTAMPSEPAPGAALSSRQPIRGTWRAAARRVAREQLN
jgi:cytoskeletal protein CcmA (bactofilin family)